jgi:hypothetical protein
MRSPRTPFNSRKASRAMPFLGTAEQLAGWFIDHLPADRDPYWDFQAPDIPNEPKDSTAGAIAASGLLELSTLTGDAAARNRYRNTAIEILTALCSSSYLAEGTSSHGLLRHRTGNKPAGAEIDVSLIWGDYYFLQALLRYRELATDSPRPALAVRLDPIHPNPFNPGVQVTFQNTVPGIVRLMIFDVRGNEVRCLAARALPAGPHTVTWDGKQANGEPAGSGVYFVRLEAEGQTVTRKATLVR